jgi:TPR repeat protein
MSAEKYQDAAFALGRMYEFGMSVPQNRAEAIKWFKKAADLGHPKGAYWARWLNDYTNCIGFRNAQEQQTLGFLRCPADPVGVIFRNSSQRLAYMREKGNEFDIMEAKAAAAHAARVGSKSGPECNSAGGTWTPDRQATFGGNCN